jgi:TRAP-type C4-dicarboxylate transport system permease small subunit
MKRWLESVVTAWAILGGLCILAIVLVTTTNITLFGLDRIARNFGGVVSGLPGYEDFVSLAVGAAALMFFPLCQLRRGHVAVDVFTEKLPRRWQFELDRFWSAVALVAVLFLLYWMVAGLQQMRSDRTLSPVIGWPIWPFFVPGLVSLLLWALVALAQLIERPAHGRP